MSTTDALLFAEQATTSLYERVDDPDARHVLPLSQAKAAYCALDGAIREEPEAAHARQSPEMVVQVRKRNGTTQLLIDGYVSTGMTKTGSNKTRHELLSHTGLHEDVETRTRVFSPIAVVAAIEDGQHPFQRVAVAVVHNYASFGNVMEPSTVLSEAVVRDHRVTDVRCDVVRVPYPLSYPNPPTVIVYDNMQQTLLKQDQLDKLRLGRDYQTAESFVTVMWDLYKKGNQSTTGEQLVAATGIASVAYWGGLVGTSLYSLGAAMPAFVIGAALPLTKDVVRGLMSGEWQNLVKPLLNAASIGVRRYIDQPTVRLRETKFTLSELAMVIESLAMRRKPQNTKAPPPSLSNLSATQHKQEALVWHWLSTAKESDAPPLDTTYMDATDAHVAQLHLRITVDDSLSCDSQTHVHNVYCGRKDAPMLAAAAAGTFDDLVRLHAAIQALKKVLTDEQAKTPTSWLYDLWIDRSWYNPFLYAATLADEIQDSAKKLEDAAKEAGKSVQQMRLAGIRRRTKKAYLGKSWTEAPVNQLNGLRTDRKDVLKRVLAGIETKLLAPLFSDPAAGSKLYLQMQKALNDRKHVLVATPPVAWERRLPQRIVSSYGAFLFSAARDTESAHADVDVGGAAARLYHEYHDASKSLSECMRSSRIALKRFVTEWEASSDTRIQLRCMCARIESTTPRFVEAVSYATLALSTPVDIRFAAALASPTEHSQRRIRVVVKRGAGTPSVLEALKLEHSDLSLMACQVFGDLWADELVALYRTSTHKQAEMLEMASVRAAVRLRAAGELLLQLVAPRRPGDDVGGFSDVALNGTDVALVATLPGRDAARLVGRVLFSQAYLAVRSVLSNELRDAARAATRAATVFERAPPVTLPHEACASLFGDRLDGLAAFLRAKDLSSDRVVLEAMVAAYPSARLLVLNADNETESIQRARYTSLPIVQARTKVVTSSELVRAMRFRLASLRIDASSLDTAVASPQSITADQLATRLAATSIGSDDHYSFYVPFGFGDARPPPTLPPCAAPLFGTVAVHGPALVGAYRSIASALDQTPQASSKSTLAIRLEPEFDCIKLPPNDPSGDETDSVHPNVVQVLRDGDEVVVRYTASRMPASRGNAPASEKTQYAVTSLAEAAGMHVHSVAASQLALVVSCTAWNAERVVQAVVAALASGDDTAEYDAVDVTYVLPPTDTRVTQWYARPSNPMAVKQSKLWQKREKEMWDAIQDGALANQKARMAKALKMARDLDTASPPIIDRTPERVERIARIERGRLNDDPVRDFKERQAAFMELFDEELVDELVAHLLERFNAQLFPDGTGEGIDTREKEGMTEEAMAPLLNVIEAVESLDPLEKREPSAPRGTALAPSARDVGEQTAPLLAALGIGMAMLTPQLGPVDVRCVAVDSSQPLATDLSQTANALAGAFSKCAIMRLSEACLVAGRNV